MSIVRLYTGNGEGKTSAALGVALRALGYDKKVIMIQFMKGRKNIGEYKIQKKLKDFKVYQFGAPEFIFLRKYMKTSKSAKLKRIKVAKDYFVMVREPSNEDIKRTERGLEFSVNIANKEKPFLLILDEINIATRFGLLKEKKVRNALKKIPKNVNVIMTGRYAPKSFVKLADLAMEVNELNRRNIKARMGIEY